MSEWVLHYQQPAEDSDRGWERESLPLGNGFLGANVFGGVQEERIQITENSFVNKRWGGLSNFAELKFEFPETEGSEYRRELDLGDAEARVRYKVDGKERKRRYFASYPERALVMEFVSPEGELSMSARVELPFCEEGRRTGTISEVSNGLEFSGVFGVYEIQYAGALILKECDGDVAVKEGKIHVCNAKKAVFVFVGATNYELRSEVFCEERPEKKLRYFDPMPIVTERLDGVKKRSFEELLQRHRADFGGLFDRVSLHLQETDEDTPTDQLLKNYREGKQSRYLEILYFQFGRYLLISSSRPQGLPANLQGIWNVHKESPWGSGYWFNINVQMNYWPAFSTNLAECFIPLVDYVKAFLPQAENNASQWILDTVPENYVEGQGACGWSVGTGCYPYTVDYPAAKGSHSGPGTGGLTSKLFWDYYDFTRDESVLKDTAYPLLMGMSRYLTRSVREYDGLLLAAYSASPEQMNNGFYVPNGTYYNTIGCGFDQQMIEENGRDFLRAADALGIENEEVLRQRSQQDFYDPIQVGWSGQIKEYREENFYSEIGERNHRHISQLMALMPGTRINSATPAWMDAAKRTLDLRTDESTGWALAHRFNAWARTGDGNRALKLFGNLLRERTNDNLWDMHPPFQIDGNFGGCAAVAEMLLQSHEDNIHVLPSLPDAWADGEVKGLCARGGFEVAVEWKDLRAVTIEVLSQKGNRAIVQYPYLQDVVVTDDEGKTVAFERIDRDYIAFETKAGGVYRLLPPPLPVKKPQALCGLTADRNTMTLRWDAISGVEYEVYRAVDSQPCYEKVAQGLSEGQFTDTTVDFAAADVVTYKVIPVVAGVEGDGDWITLNHATKLQRDRYLLMLEAKDMNRPY